MNLRCFNPQFFIASKFGDTALRADRTAGDGYDRELGIVIDAVEGTLRGGSDGPPAWAAIGWPWSDSRSWVRASAVFWTTTTARTPPSAPQTWTT